jgi:hypothetical protein
MPTSVFAGVSTELQEDTRGYGRGSKARPASSRTRSRLRASNVVDRRYPGHAALRHWIPHSGPEAEEGVRLARQSIIAEDPITLGCGGLALSHLTGDNIAALSGAVDHAIGLNPNYANGVGIRALILAYLDRPEEAILSAQAGDAPQPARSWHVRLLLGAGRWAEESLRANIGIPGLRQKLSLCGHLGRRDAAEECLRQLREIHPEVTIAGISRGLPKGYSPELTAHFLEGLRKAGVPEA